MLHHVSYGRDATPRRVTPPRRGRDLPRLLLRHHAHVGARREALRAPRSPRSSTEWRRCRSASSRGVAAGTPYEDLHDESHRQVSAILKDAGVVKASAEEIDARGISRAFYPHGLGHSLGLQTHDVGCAVVKPKPDNPFLRNTSAITPGQVFTIEPGLYFVDSLLRRAPEQAGGGPRRLEPRRRARAARRHPHRGRHLGHRHRDAQLLPRGPPGRRRHRLSGSYFFLSRSIDAELMQ